MRLSRGLLNCKRGMISCKSRKTVDFGNLDGERSLQSKAQRWILLFQHLDQIFDRNFKGASNFENSSIVNRCHAISPHVTHKRFVIYVRAISNFL